MGRGRGAAGRGAVRPPRGGGWRAFVNADEANAWGQDNYGTWAEGLTDAEVEQIRSYTAAGYNSVNAHLRRPELEIANDRPWVAEAIENLDAIFANAAARVPEDVLAYRGFGHHLPIFRVGDVIRDDAYVSASLLSERPALNFGPQIAVLRVPVGSRALYLGGLAAGTARHPLGVPSEAELLLPRGTSFRVVATPRRGPIVLEVID